MGDRNWQEWVKRRKYENEDQRQTLVHELRLVGHQKVDQLQALRDEIEDEERMFESTRMTECERRALEHKKKVLRYAEEYTRQRGALDNLEVEEQQEEGEEEETGGGGPSVLPGSNKRRWEGEEGADGAQAVAGQAADGQLTREARRLQELRDELEDRECVFTGVALTEAERRQTEFMRQVLQHAEDSQPQRDEWEGA